MKFVADVAEFDEAAETGFGELAVFQRRRRAPERGDSILDFDSDVEVAQAGFVVKQLPGLNRLNDIVDRIGGRGAGWHRFNRREAEDRELKPHG